MCLHIEVVLGKSLSVDAWRVTRKPEVADRQDRANFEP